MGKFVKAFFQISPKKMFLLDGIGASFTAITLALILPMFQDQIGIPTETLITMGIVGFFYGIYSFSCFYFVRANYSIWLKGIILANLLYCVASAGVVTYYIEQLKLLGFLYFSFEISVILAVVVLEIVVLQKQAIQGDGR